MIRTATILFVSCLWLSEAGGNQSGWRAASETELKQIIPARAPVEKERIETEFRTASGITDGKGHFVAGVVLITAGYSAEGKYSNYFVAQVPVKIGGLSLKPGEYVFGWRHRTEDALDVKFYTAREGTLLGTVEAPRKNRTGRVESFHIYSPAEGALMEIGRFACSYELNQ